MGLRTRVQSFIGYRIDTAFNLSLYGIEGEQCKAISCWVGFERKSFYLSNNFVILQLRVDPV